MMSSLRADFRHWGRFTRQPIWPPEPYAPTHKEQDPRPWPRRQQSKSSLLSTADTGFFYVTKKNSRTMTEKMVKKKYDPVAKKHVEFKEAKIK